MNKLPSGTQFGSEDEIKALGDVTGPLYHYTKHRDSVLSGGFLGGRGRSMGDGIYFMNDPEHLKGWTGEGGPIKAYIVGKIAEIGQVVIPVGMEDDIEDEFGTRDVQELCEPGTLGDFLRALGYQGWTDGYQYAALSPSAIAIVAEPKAAVESLLSEDCKVNWDRRGIGHVPKQIDLDYFGFTKEMTASEFQRLVPPGVSRVATAGDLKPKAEAGEGIAPPFLIVDWDEKNKIWQVLNHEGRSRSRLVCGHDKLPVDIFPRHIRARDLTPEMIAAPFIPQRD